MHLSYPDHQLSAPPKQLLYKMDTIFSVRPIETQTRIVRASSSAIERMDIPKMRVVCAIIASFRV
jgi:hypothetical protein